jgi:hypothetical protein
MALEKNVIMREKNVIKSNDGEGMIVLNHYRDIIVLFKNGDVMMRINNNISSVDFDTIIKMRKELIK